MTKDLIRGLDLPRRYPFRFKMPRPLGGVTVCSLMPLKNARRIENLERPDDIDSDHLPVLLSVRGEPVAEPALGPPLRRCSSLGRGLSRYRYGSRGWGRA